uniref:SH2 domain-containing protein n=1 Tax=Macrostomum lignano TaxID=282301 RepID=A0A1I8F7E2_9PLAT
ERQKTSARQPKKKLWKHLAQPRSQSLFQVARQRPTAAAQSWGQAGNLPPLKIPPPPTKPLPAPPTLENADDNKTTASSPQAARCLASAPLPESETAQQRRQHLQHLDRPGFRQPLCLSSSQSGSHSAGDAVEQLYQLADRETSDYQSTASFWKVPPVRTSSLKALSRAARAPLPCPAFGRSDCPNHNGQPFCRATQTVRLFTESGRTVNLLVARPSPGCSPSFSNSSPSTDDSRFYSNYAVYDVATHRGSRKRPLIQQQ